MYRITKTTQGTYAAYVLEDSDAGITATIVPEKGGMITSMTKSGAEYIWLREPNFSLPERPRCAVPILFPACGRCADGANTFAGKAYPMDIHGIAHSLPWEVVGQDTADGAALTIRLTDSAQTHESYPYSFCVTITYLLYENVLRIEQNYANTGEQEMPFSFGFHPYFVISDVRNLVWHIGADHEADPDTGKIGASPAVIDFPYNEDQTTRYYQDVMSPMAFTDTALQRTVKVHFDTHFRNAVLWSQCQLGFVCMEPWNGWPNSLNTPQHETLAPGASLDAEIAIEI